jgi:hypothetical protein
LHWRRADGRWYPYDGPPPAREVAELLPEIDADPDGVFWS